jgi:aspartyl-tRNA(Asn)/glutamyl-tRNA(Gln) amidotransferase subunit C
MLTDKEIDHIAKLARLELDQAHKDKFKKELSSILGYIDQLEKVDVTGVEPLYQVTGLTHQTRPDEHRGDFPADEKSADLLIGQAPMHQGRFIKVKAIKNA